MRELRRVLRRVLEKSTKGPLPVAHTDEGKIILLNKSVPAHFKLKPGDLVDLEITHETDRYCVALARKVQSLRLRFEANLMKVGGKSYGFAIPKDLTTREVVEAHGRRFMVEAVEVEG